MTWTTFFDDVFAQSMRAETMTVEELAELIRDTVAPSKDTQPLFKLAHYGAVRSAAGSLRHDGNVVSVSGCELDYDGEVMSLAEAAARLDAANLIYVAYTTARHTPAAPRSRCILLFSRELPPSERARMVSRANGLLGGVLSAESSALSTAFFYGNIAGKPEAEVIVGDGEEYINEADDLDATALPFRPARNPGTVKVASPTSTGSTKPNSSS